MGEVAGGMTQVVNSYLAWDFDRFDVDVIVSRDGSRGIAALALFARAAWRILRLPQREKTVVVVHLSQDGSFIREGLLLELASRRGVATVAHLHGSSFVQYAKSNPGRVTKVLSHADAIVVLSDATLAAVRSLLPTAQAQIVPNAVLPGHPTPKTRTVVFGGSVGRRKGVDVLVEAWRDIADKDGWQLDVVGPIAEPAIVPDDLPSATFHGALPHSTLMAMLDKSEVAVLPSRDEAMPMFVLEALARDACVVATSVGGIESVIGEGAGVLVPPDDSASLRTALEDVMGDDELRAALIERGRAKFDSEFAAAAVHPQLEELWLGALTTRTGGR